MKKIYYLFACLTIVTLACGTQLPAQPSTDVNPPSHDVSSPVQVAVIAEPTEAAPTWITTGALNVRAEANADSTILGTLEPLTEIQVFITDIQGDDCFGGEWYAITSPIEGFVCSLWVVRK